MKNSSVPSVFTMSNDLWKTLVQVENSGASSSKAVIDRHKPRDNNYYRGNHLLVPLTSTEWVDSYPYDFDADAATPPSSPGGPRIVVTPTEDVVESISHSGLQWNARGRQPHTSELIDAAPLPSITIEHCDNPRVCYESHYRVVRAFKH